jgi:uncharacterized protein (TIGR03000 family)
MFRTASALVVLAGFASVAGAQPSQPFPLSPGVTPTSPFIPFGAIPQRPGPNAPNTVFFPVALPSGWGVGWAYQTFSPWTGFSYAFGGLVPPGAPMMQQQVIVEPAAPRRAEPVVVLANEFPATLTVQLPAAAEVWLDGKKVKGDKAEEVVLTSPVLGPNQQYTFLVKARWTNKGKTYEAKRAITLNPGDRSRLGIVSGDEVRE